MPKHTKSAGVLGTSGGIMGRFLGRKGGSSSGPAAAPRLKAEAFLSCCPNPRCTRPDDGSSSTEGGQRRRWRLGDLKRMQNGEQSHMEREVFPSFPPLPTSPDPLRARAQPSCLFLRRRWLAGAILCPCESGAVLRNGACLGDTETGVATVLPVNAVT